jgi:Protein of unknown function (DUF1573)
MKKLILFFAFASLSMTTFAQNLVAKADGPDIKFVSEVIDYKKVAKGANGEREFVFTNTGNAPLELKQCQGSCGCTVPVCPKEMIMPGQKGSIKVKYDTQRVGQFTKYVTVTTNVTGKDSIRLEIKGDVVAEADAVPAKATSLLAPTSGF